MSTTTATVVSSPPAPTSGVGAPPEAPARTSRRRIPWRPTTRAGWITAAIGLLTAAIYSWGLDGVGLGNDYYAAAVKAGTKSWKALFFGAIDPGSFITVDKPPVAFWLQGISARVFGFNSWAVLLPEAACGVASVLIVHRLVRKWAGNTAAHLTALALALTPVAVAMFRFNNPDALLTFLLVASAWALWSAVETGKTSRLVLAGALMGFAFDTKMLQAFLVLPALALVYLWAGPPKLGKRIVQLLAAAGALFVSAGWYVAIVELMPKSARPYIGGSTNNSLLDLVFGYNGLARIFGRSGPGPGGGGRGGGGPAGGGGPGFGGTSGWLRLFNTSNGGQISWLFPLAAAGLVAGLVITFRAKRTDKGRAGWLLWGGWALTSVAVFSLSKGIYHEYYTVALAPAIAALAGAGAVTLWNLGRMRSWNRWILPAVVVATGIWAVVLLHRTPTYYSWLRAAITAGAVAAGAGLWGVWFFRRRWLLLVAGGVAATTLLAGPAAYAVTTVRSPSRGALASAGPGGGGGPGGDRQATANAALISYLEANKGSATYLVAAFGSQSSAPIIIATGEPVITIGGFGGSDPAPTLAQFQKLVAEGRVRFLLVGGGGGGGFVGAFGGGGFGGPGGGRGGNQTITAWAEQAGTQVPTTLTGGATVYDLSRAS